MMNNSDKIILDLCGGTGAWSRPYKEQGYDVRLITLPEYDLFTYEPPEHVYGILAAPMCTEFSLARTRTEVRDRDLKMGMSLVERCLKIIWEVQYKLPYKNAKITGLKFWALENPKGFLRYFLGNPPFQFSPFDFGDNYKKKTQLWGNFIEPVKNPIECNSIKFDKTLLADLPELPEGYVYDKGCKMDKRQVRRSITPQGFARAFYEANK